MLAGALSNIILQENILRGITAHSPGGPGHVVQVWTKTISHSKPVLIVICWFLTYLSIYPTPQTSGLSVEMWWREKYCQVKGGKQSRSKKHKPRHLNRVNWQIPTARWEPWKNSERGRASPGLFSGDVSDIPTNWEERRAQLSLNVDMTTPGKQGAEAENVLGATPSSLKANHSIQLHE